MPRTTDRDAGAQPLVWPFEPGGFRATTTGPATPEAPRWMCAATAVGRFSAAMRYQTRPSPARSRIVAVPVATGSPAGVSASPVSATPSAVPPAAAVMTVRGQPPAGTGAMSAGFRADAAPRRSTYGFAADAVRLQNGLPAPVRASAVARTTPASAATGDQSRFIPPSPSSNDDGGGTRAGRLRFERRARPGRAGRSLG